MRALVILALAFALSACSVRQAAVNRVGDALSAGGDAFAADDDPELVRAAAPFSLKLVESLLAESPGHRGLLLAGARGFTQYAYAFVQQDADEAEDRDVAQQRLLEDRARRLYRRARDYGLRGLALSRPGSEAADVPLLYWTAVSWAALIGLSKDQPEMLADLAAVDALVERALALDEGHGRGALHTFLISYEAARPGTGTERARRHFQRALELSGGRDAAPLVALAEAVCVQEQRRAEFEALLQRALAVDADHEPALRLANRVAQRRARWLLGRAERLFID